METLIAAVMPTGRWSLMLRQGKPTVAEFDGSLFFSIDYLISL